MNTPKFIIVPIESSQGPILVDAVTPADLEFAETGLSAIIRLSDYASYLGHGWKPIPPGRLTKADPREFPDQGPFHS